MSTLPDVRRGHETGSPFDALRRHRPDGTEFWSARDLLPLMGYGRWERFADAIDRAKIAATNSGMDLTSHFRGAAKVSGARGPAQEDVHLTRQAAYLVAMNGDPRKREIADAQAYFVVRTMQAEVAIPTQLSTLDMIIASAQEMKRVQATAELAVRQSQETSARMDAIEGAYDEYAALGYAKLHSLPTDRPYLVRLGKAATAAMRAEGQQPRKRQDATFGQINIYPVWALDEALLAITS